jgi:hypothetical protein
MALVVIWNQLVSKMPQKFAILLTKWFFVVKCGNNIYIFELYKKGQQFWKSIFQVFTTARRMPREG